MGCQKQRLLCRVRGSYRVLPARPAATEQYSSLQHQAAFVDAPHPALPRGWPPLQVCGLKWSPDDRELASGGNDNLLYIWSPQTTQPLLRFQEHQVRWARCGGAQHTQAAVEEEVSEGGSTAAVALGIQHCMV